MYRETGVTCRRGRPPLPADAAWLVDNYAFLQTQIREVRESLPRVVSSVVCPARAAYRTSTRSRRIWRTWPEPISPRRGCKQLLETIHASRSLQHGGTLGARPDAQTGAARASAPPDLIGGRRRRPSPPCAAFESVPWRDLVESVAGRAHPAEGSGRCLCAR